MFDEFYQVLDELNVKIDLNIYLKDNAISAFSSRHISSTTAQDGITEITSQPSNPKV